MMGFKIFNCLLCCGKRKNKEKVEPEEFPFSRGSISYKPAISTSMCYSYPIDSKVEKEENISSQPSEEVDEFVKDQSPIEKGVIDEINSSLSLNKEDTVLKKVESKPYQCNTYTFYDDEYTPFNTGAYPTRVSNTRPMYYPDYKINVTTDDW